MDDAWAQLATCPTTPAWVRLPLVSRARDDVHALADCLTAFDSSSRQFSTWKEDHGASLLTAYKQLSAVVSRLGEAAKEVCDVAVSAAVGRIVSALGQGLSVTSDIEQLDSLLQAAELALDAEEDGSSGYLHAFYQTLPVFADFTNFELMKMSHRLRRELPFVEVGLCSEFGRHSRRVLDALMGRPGFQARLALEVSAVGACVVQVACHSFGSYDDIANAVKAIPARTSHAMFLNLAYLPAPVALTVDRGDYIDCVKLMADGASIPCRIDMPVGQRRMMKMSGELDQLLDDVVAPLWPGDQLKRAAFAMAVLLTPGDNLHVVRHDQVMCTPVPQLRDRWDRPELAPSNVKLCSLGREQVRWRSLVHAYSH